MDLFYSDISKNQETTWEKLLDDLNNTTKYNPYCYQQDFYSVFKHIILSLLLEKVFITPGFSGLIISRPYNLCFVLSAAVRLEPTKPWMPVIKMFIILYFKAALYLNNAFRSPIYHTIGLLNIQEFKIIQIFLKFRKSFV
jgi:hypothetical protein